MILGANGRPLPSTGPLDMEKALLGGFLMGVKLLGTDSEKGGFIVECRTMIDGRPVRVEAHGETLEEAVGSAAFGAIAGAMQHYGPQEESSEAPSM